MAKWIITFLFPCTLYAQWTELAPLPEAVSNNAVVAAKTSNGTYAFSFSGILAGKTHTDIHKKNFRYSVDDNLWEQIADLPSGNGRIAAGASVVKGLIYIIGGYEVFANGNERSFDEVHIYNPETNSFLENGTPIPTPIDDHVQVVYQDSLIYVITGWSNTTNIGLVQVYDPGLDEWKQATPLPNSSQYKVFGASGSIVGDTIYYSGGARALNNFPPSNTLRKGAINIDDPYKIAWSGVTANEAVGYRMAGFSYTGQCYWYGGSKVTYNYNGIAYNGSGGVSPIADLSSFKIDEQKWEKNAGLPVRMDLRGIARISDSEFMIAGGMIEDQVVTDRCFKFDMSALTSTTRLPLSEYSFVPNPSTGIVHLKNAPRHGLLEVLDQAGRVVYRIELSNKSTLDLRKLETGIYFFCFRESGTAHVYKWIKI